MSDLYPYVHSNSAGKFNIKSWTRDVSFDDNAREQVAKIASMPFITPHVAIMPDVHLGIGATIGSVIPSLNVIIPAAVGVDLGCVDKDTEFLTPTGWKKISDWDNDLVMQYNPRSGGGTYVQPINYIRKPADKFYHIKTKYGVNQMLSPEHKVIYRGPARVPINGKLYVTTAEEIVKRHNDTVLGFSGRFLTTFKPQIKTEVPLSDEQIRVMVMVMADGHYSKNAEGNVCVLKFRKLRKFERAIYLLAMAGIPFKEKVNLTEGKITYHLRFRAPIIEKDISYFWPASLEQLDAIVNEVFHWDGTAHLGVFFTRLKSAADFMSYAFSAMGFRSRVLVDVRDSGTDYRVFALQNTETGLKGSPKGRIEVINCEGTDVEKFCFTVPTGYWVMRREGCIAITGNCGMISIRTSLKANQLPDSLAALRSKIESLVPHGRASTHVGRQRDPGAWGDVPDDVARAWLPLKARFDVLTDRHPWLNKTNNVKHLGTLGSGNHFIEICLDETDTVWVMLHSGSRGVGNRIGTHFIDLAKRDMERYHIQLPDKDLAYIPHGSPNFDDYIQTVHWAQDFARVNREVMLARTIQALRDTIPIPFEVETMAISCHHNYISRENHYGQNLWVTRKGAIRARLGEMGIIPGSMGAKSFIVRGLGNPESFCSCSHGAGRVMSRTQAVKLVSLDEHIKATEGVECRKDIDVIDETPAAYKSIDAVMAAQSDLVEIVHTLKQIVCVKG